MFCLDVSKLILCRLKIVDFEPQSMEANRNSIRERVLNVFESAVCPREFMSSPIRCILHSNPRSNSVRNFANFAGIDTADSSDDEGEATYKALVKTDGKAGSGCGFLCHCV